MRTLPILLVFLFLRDQTNSCPNLINTGYHRLSVSADTLADLQIYIAVMVYGLHFSIFFYPFLYSSLEYFCSICVNIFNLSFDITYLRMYLSLFTVTVIFHSEVYCMYVCSTLKCFSIYLCVPLPDLKDPCQMMGL